MPLTTPVLPTVAMPVELLDHVPPPVADDNDVVAPTHTDSVPEIVAGSELTVTVAVRTQPETV
jgi:hypothetical protein